MELFKKSKKAPFKFRGFQYIGRHIDYDLVHYYYREDAYSNFELMEARTELNRKGKPILSAGSSIKYVDTFMANYLHAKINKEKVTSTFVKKTLEKEFGKESEENKRLYTIISSKATEDISMLDEFKEITKNGYRVLYANNTIKLNPYGVEQVVFVKDDFIKGANREYTLFKVLEFRLKPSAIKKGKKEYFVEKYPDVVISSDILNKENN